MTHKATRIHVVKDPGRPESDVLAVPCPTVWP